MSSERRLLAASQRAAPLGAHSQPEGTCAHAQLRVVAGVDASWLSRRWHACKVAVPGCAPHRAVVSTAVWRGATGSITRLLIDQILSHSCGGNIKEKA